VNFADESAYLMSDNVQNEVVTIHRYQEALKMSLYTWISSTINCFVTKHRYINCTYSTSDTNFTGWSRTLWVRCGFSELQ
jgi:hypothetical protein